MYLSLSLSLSLSLFYSSYFFPPPSFPKSLFLFTRFCVDSILTRGQDSSSSSFRSSIFFSFPSPLNAGRRHVSRRRRRRRRCRRRRVCWHHLTYQCPDECPLPPQFLRGFTFLPNFLNKFTVLEFVKKSRKFYFSEYY